MTSLPCKLTNLFMKKMWITDMGKNKTYNKAIECRISQVIKLIIVQETQYRQFGNVEF